MSGVIDHDSVGALFTIDSMEKKTTKTRKIQEMRPTVNSHLNMGITHSNFNWQEAQTTVNHNSTIAWRQKELAGQLRLSAPEAEQGSAEQILVYHLYHHLT